MTMRQYKDCGGAYLDVASGTFFPPNHAMYVEMQELIALGEAQLLPPDPPPTPPIRLHKLTIVDRLTDDEFSAAMAFFEENPRVRERWVAAIDIDVTNPETRAMFESLYGQQRADEILAPE